MCTCKTHQKQRHTHTMQATRQGQPEIDTDIQTDTHMDTCKSGQTDQNTEMDTDIHIDTRKTHQKRG